MKIGLRLGWLQATLILLAAAPRAGAQGNGPASTDLAIPESPAFTVLGASPQTVTRPSVPKDLATSLLSGIDQNGNFQTGFAVDTVPYLLIQGAKVSLSSYSTHYFTRLLARTSWSAGSTRGASSSDKSTRLAVGMRVTLFDLGDPHGDSELMRCIEASAKVFQDEFISPDLLEVQERNVEREEADRARKPGETDEQFQDRQLKMVMDRQRLELARIKNRRVADRDDDNRGTCVAQSRKRNFNRSSMAVAGAPSFISTNGSNSEMQGNGTGIWTSVAYGFEGVPALKDSFQLIFQGTYRNKETVADPLFSGSFLVQNRTVAGFGFRVGRPSFQLSWEGSVVRRRLPGLATETSFETAVMGEARITDGLWLNLGMGTETGRRDGANKLFLLTNFKWGFSKSGPEKTAD